MITKEQLETARAIYDRAQAPAIQGTAEWEQAVRELAAAVGFRDPREKEFFPNYADLAYEAFEACRRGYLDAQDPRVKCADCPACARIVHMASGDWCHCSFDSRDPSHRQYGFNLFRGRCETCHRPDLQQKKEGAQ